MSDPAEDPGVATTGGRFLTPAEARQDAADRLVGRRTLLALRVVLVVTGLVWGTAYLLIHPDVGRIDSPVLTLVAVEVWVLPPIAALIAIIVCRRPARRQMWGMREGINVGGGMGVLEGGIGEAVLSYLGFGPVAVTVSGVAAACGLTALVLHYLWRTPKAP